MLRNPKNATSCLLKFSSMLLILFSYQAHSQSIEDLVSLDVNDISVLFPMDRATGKPWPAIAATDRSEVARIPDPRRPGQAIAIPESFRPELWSETLFQKAVAHARMFGVSFRDHGPFAGPGAAGNTVLKGSGAEVRANWHVVGFRVDICAPGSQMLLPTAERPAELNNLIRAGKLPPGCIITFRLIGQPVVNGVPLDFSSHIVFALGAWELVDGRPSDLRVAPQFAGSVERMFGIIGALNIIKGLSGRLRAVTDGYPLGVHPGLLIASQLDNPEDDARLCPSTATFLDPAALLRVPEQQVPCALRKFIRAIILGSTKVPGGLAGAGAARTIAFMGLGGNGPEPWTFIPGSVEQDSTRVDLNSLRALPIREGSEPATEDRDKKIPIIRINSEDLKLSSVLGTVRTFNGNELNTRNPFPAINMSMREHKVINGLSLRPNPDRSPANPFPFVPINEFPAADQTIFPNDLHTEHLFNIQDLSKTLDNVRAEKPVPGLPRLVADLKGVRPISGVPLKHIVYALNNPNVTNVRSNDCVSCHTIATRIWNLRIYDESNVQDGLVYQIPEGITGALQKNVVPRGIWNVRNFGYFGARPAISTRSLMESVEVLKLANRLLGDPAKARGNGIRGCNMRRAYVCSIQRGDNCFNGCQGVSPTFTARGDQFHPALGLTAQPTARTSPPRRGQDANGNRTLIR